MPATPPFPDSPSALTGTILSFMPLPQLPFPPPAHGLSASIATTASALPLAVSACPHPPPAAQPTVCKPLPSQLPAPIHLISSISNAAVVQKLNSSPFRAQRQHGIPASA